MPIKKGCIKKLDVSARFLSGGCRAVESLLPAPCSASCGIPFYPATSNTIPPNINLAVTEVRDLRTCPAIRRCMVTALTPSMSDTVHRSGPAEATGSHVQSIKIIQPVPWSHCNPQEPPDWLLPRSSDVMMPNKIGN